MCQMLLSQEVNQVTKDAKGHEKMLGEITKDGFTSNSFNAWFTCSQRGRPGEAYGRRYPARHETRGRMVNAAQKVVLTPRSWQGCTEFGVGHGATHGN